MDKSRFGLFSSLDRKVNLGIGCFLTGIVRVKGRSLTTISQLVGNLLLSVEESHRKDYRCSVLLFPWFIPALCSILCSVSPFRPCYKTNYDLNSPNIAKILPRCCQLGTHKWIK